MIKRTIITALLGLIVAAAPSQAQTYRGMVELVPAVELIPTHQIQYDETVIHAAIAPGIATAHGIQLSRRHFVGLGAEFIYSNYTMATDGFGYRRDEDESKSFATGLPVYAMWRMDFFAGHRWNPFIDLRGGWQFGEAPGVYANFNFGMRLRITNRSGFNLSLGARMRRVQYVPYDDANYLTVAYQLRTYSPSIVLRVGWDF